MTASESVPLVLIPDTYAETLEVERRVLGDSVRFEVYNAESAEEIPERCWRQADTVLLWHRIRMTDDVIAKLNRCKLIVRVGVGYDNVDLAACSARGIVVSNVPNYGTTEIADHALALLLSLVRGLPSYDERLRHDMAGSYFAEGVSVVRRLKGSVFGAVGLGRIGTAVARRAAAFDMKVLFYDPFLPEGHELGVGFDRTHDLDQLLERADIVSLHTPLNDQTRAMVNAGWLAGMKPGALLINVARGKLVDLDAIEVALRSGQLGAVGLDVLPQEPPDPRHPLLEAWLEREAWLQGRLALTPHAAFFSDAAYLDMRTFAAEIVRDFLFSGKVRNNVNPDWRRPSSSGPDIPALT
ncbi:C-terminal binding protein [Oryzicola mucosus]|uniref:C-terminal binding protein n=1 Tax=Oryzicola mucosus TaxID=2767425 RepID=A0A8J6U1X8_9HYPH|nr:C-terminal binding protein [Oryzicola mucosus]MBD0417461.1 C-terminal binding protein [Oryzicola mucosus]